MSSISQLSQPYHLYLIPQEFASVFGIKRAVKSIKKARRARFIPSILFLKATKEELLMEGIRAGFSVYERHSRSKLSLVDTLELLDALDEDTITERLWPELMYRDAMACLALEQNVIAIYRLLTIVHQKPASDYTPLALAIAAELIYLYNTTLKQDENFKLIFTLIQKIIKTNACNFTPSLDHLDTLAKEFMTLALQHPQRGNSLGLDMKHYESILNGWE